MGLNGTLFPQQHLQMCLVVVFSVSEDTSPVQSAHKTDLETWIIQRGDGAAVWTRPSKLARKLQGEEAPPEGSIE